MTDTGNAPAPAVMPVSLLVSSARLIIERHLGLVWVAGEISNYTRAASGHSYFLLKDEAAQVRCVLWRQKALALDFALANGLAVEVRATPTIYDARGEFQLNVDNVRLAGLGALYERFDRLKKKLEAAGWFAPERKRPLPPHPRAVGIVTSTRAAALRDVLTTLARRWPALRVVIYPCAVQGDGAVAEIAGAVRVANERREVEVLIVCRGGGSIEDLWAFNEEAVARAVFESTLPVVSGVGHETDFTICDFVADVRAPTPTGAAALVTPDRMEFVRRVAQLVGRQVRAMTHGLDVRVQRIDAAARGLVHPAARLAAQVQRSRELTERLAGSWRRQQALRAAAARAAASLLGRELRSPLSQVALLESVREALRRIGRDRVALAQQRLAAFERGLAHLNPQGVLERGYAIVAAADGRIVQDSRDVAPGDDVALKFARGGAGARITKVES